MSDMRFQLGQWVKHRWFPQIVGRIIERAEFVGSPPMYRIAYWSRNEALVHVAIQEHFLESANDSSAQSAMQETK